MGLGLARRPRGAGRRPRIEVRSNSDGGWYDGDLSLVRLQDPSDAEVRVHFTNFDESEDELWHFDILGSEAEIRKRVRLLSHQLQDRECERVTPGSVVCAHYLSADGLESRYYDSLIVEVHKGDHFKEDGEHICGCSFSVQWIEGPVEGTFDTLKCPSISLIVPRDVENHPLVRTLLQFARDFNNDKRVGFYADEGENCPVGNDRSRKSLTELGSRMATLNKNVEGLKFSAEYKCGVSDATEEDEEQEGKMEMYDVFEDWDEAFLGDDILEDTDLANVDELLDIPEDVEDHLQLLQRVQDTLSEGIVNLIKVINPTKKRSSVG